MLLLRTDLCRAQQSSRAALVFGAQKGRGVQHTLDGRCEMQRAHGRKSHIVLCLMLDTFLLLTAAGIWHQIMAFLRSLWCGMQHSSRVYLALGDLDVWSPGYMCGGKNSLSKSLVSNYNLS